MVPIKLKEELTYIGHGRENRQKYAHLILANRELLPELIEILFMVDDKISCRAGWLLEFVCREDIKSILPHLNYFSQHMHKVYRDPAVRPVAKICEYLTEAAYKKKDKDIINALTSEIREKMITLCFDYMITDQKVAVKAYSMNILFLYGRDYDWIYPELLIILERDFNKGTAAFKARARHLIPKLKKPSGSKGKIFN